jgi:hypothetical protein
MEEGRSTINILGGKPRGSHLPVSCRSLVDRYSSLGNRKSRIYLFKPRGKRPPVRPSIYRRTILEFILKKYKELKVIQLRIGFIGGTL